MSDNSREVVIVTGAGGGIGGAIVDALASSYIVIAVDKSTPSLKRLTERLRAQHLSCVPSRADITKHSGIRAVVRAAKSGGRCIGWIIHSAGFISTKESLVVAPRIMEETFSVNLFSCIQLTAACLPKLTGGLIAISSTAGLWSNPRYPLYAASKAALNSYTQALARNFEADGRMAISICPGPTNTRMRERIAGDASQKQRPAVIATLVAALVTGKTNYKNGDILVVRDGGSALHERLS